MFTLLLLSGCIAENNDNCFKGIPLGVRLPAHVSPETVGDMSIYVFDDKDLLIDTLSVNGTAPVLLKYPGIPVLHCIALCNVKNGSLLVNSLYKGDPFSKGLVSLNPVESPTRAERNIYSSPADLFYGDLKFENNMTTNFPEEQFVNLSRMTASMIITLRGVDMLVPEGSSGEGYSLIVHDTPSALDFRGVYGGDPAAYRFQWKQEPGKDYVMPIFNLFPPTAGKGLTIDLYYEGKLLRSVTADSGGQPIVPVAGKTLNVLINYRMNVDVQVQMAGWGEETIWKEWG